MRLAEGRGQADGETSTVGFIGWTVVVLVGCAGWHCTNYHLLKPYATATGPALSTQVWKLDGLVTACIAVSLPLVARSTGFGVVQSLAIGSQVWAPILLAAAVDRRRRRAAHS